ncbi:MAG: hypothetical protein ABI401_10185 [Candidatus Dormibacter sp.]
MDDGFVHHVRATHRLLDACVALSPEQLEIAVPGTYGSILATARHLVGGDSLYLFWLTGDRAHAIKPDGMDFGGLRDAIERNGRAWSAFGRQRDASVGIRLAQVLDHGTDHRSQMHRSHDARHRTARHHGLYAEQFPNLIGKRGRGRRQSP